MSAGAPRAARVAGVGCAGDREEPATTSREKPEGLSEARRAEFPDGDERDAGAGRSRAGPARVLTGSTFRLSSETSSSVR